MAGRAQQGTLSEAEAKRLERENAGKDVTATKTFEDEPGPGSADRGPQTADSGLETAIEPVELPSVVGSIAVPQIVDELQALLDKTKTNKDPLPIRASHLPVPVQRALFAIGGIPEIVNPGEVMILAGRPYVSAAGAVQAALDLQQVTEFYSRHLRTELCADMGCKGVKPNEPNAKTLVFEASAVTKDGRRFSREGYICRHTCFPDRVAETGQTRVRRKLALELLGLQDDPELEAIIVENELALEGTMRDDMDPETGEVPLPDEEPA